MLIWKELWADGRRMLIITVRKGGVDWRYGMVMCRVVRDGGMGSRYGTVIWNSDIRC